MSDILLTEFFSKQRWETALDTAVEKKLNRSLLKQLCEPDKRVVLLNDIASGTYRIQPPHTAKIPKDNGDFRTVYINTDMDRIVLSIINDMLFDLCPMMIHPRCTSYQKGIGCGKIVRTVSHKLQHIMSSTIGVKSDLSKYFDSVRIEDIDDVFDAIETIHGKSCIIDILRDYYHNDTIIDQGTKTEKYTSLKQGCAVAAFLADAALYDLDTEMDRLCEERNIEYYRYSDDTIIIGEDYDVDLALSKMKQILAEKELHLNEKKTKRLPKDKWFEFLGYAMKEDQITLSRHRVKTFQKEIEERTRNKKNLHQTLRSVYNYLYDGPYSWCSNVLSTINCTNDIQTLNAFVMDAVRASVTKKSKIGGLGSDFANEYGTILRGKGRNVKANRNAIPFIEGYHSLMNMKSIYITNKAAYATMVRTMI